MIVCTSDGPLPPSDNDRRLVNEYLEQFCIVVLITTIHGDSLNSSV